MWISVPQMPVLWILTSTSSGPIAGTGSILQPKAGLGFAFDQGFHRAASGGSSDDFQLATPGVA